MQQAANREPSKVEYALALVVYRKEQEAMKHMVQEMLGKYDKPKMTVKELRALLDSQLGDISPSQEITKMREEGY
jgi:hypothetical protein